MQATTLLRPLVVIWLLGFCAVTGMARGEEEAAPEKAAKAQSLGEAELVNRQSQVSDKFRELKAVLIRMAELTATTDPRRATLLRQAVAQANERGIDGQFESLLELLKQEQLSKAVKGQGEVKQDLDAILELLMSEDRSKTLESEKERIRGYIKEVNRLIKQQKVIQAETGGDGDGKKLVDDEGKLADKTGDLARKIEKNEGKGAQAGGKPSEAGKPGAEGDPKDGEKQDGDTNNAEKKDGESKDGAPGEGKSKDGSPSDGEGKGGEKKDGEAKDGEKKDGEKKDGEAKDGEKKDGEKNDGEKQDSEKNDSEKEDGEKGDASKGEGEGKGKGKGQGEGKGKGQGQGEGGGEGGEQQQQQQAANPAQQRLKQAQERMKEAQRKLEEAKRAEAKDKQEEALRELEQAKAELEEILRQLREEEIARMLAALEQRFRKMLQMQIAVYEGTKRLDKIPEKNRDRDDEIESGRLSRKESEIVGEADRAMALLAEDGTAVAFPEAVLEMREDMEQVVVRLAQFKVNMMTQGIEEDIIAALEEMIEALKKAQKDMKDKQSPPNGQPGEPQDDPLVDQIAELKMIRALQMRVNRRTQRYGELVKTEQAEQPELIQALNRLAEREERIYRVTRDIVAGRNK